MKNNSLLIMATVFIGLQCCLAGCSGKTSSADGFLNDTTAQTSPGITTPPNRSQNAMGDFVTASKAVTASEVHDDAGTSNADNGKS